MKIKRSSLAAAGISLLSLGHAVVWAAVPGGGDYPNKPIRIVTHGAGGIGDLAARFVAQGLTDNNWGQPVVVDNRGGGSAAMEVVSKAPPDGYMLLLTANVFVGGPLVQRQPYDPVKDFAPITLVGSSPNILAVHPALPAKSVKELIALAKARPGELNFTGGSTGGPAHLAGELFKSMAGVNMVRVSYNSDSQEIADLIGGYVQMTFGSVANVGGLIKTGRLKALAVTSAQPSPLFPGMPTIAASGLPGFNVEAFTWVFAPAKTPDAIIQRLNQEIVRALNRTDIKERFLNSGAEAKWSSPEELGALIKSETDKWSKLIKDAGIRVN